MTPNDKGKATQTARWHDVAEYRGAERAVWGRSLLAGQAFLLLALQKTVVCPGYFRGYFREQVASSKHLPIARPGS